MSSRPAFFINVQVISSSGDAFGGKPISVIAATIVPVITSFTSSALRVAKGKPIVLRWSVKDATRVKIDPIDLTLDASVTSYTFVPAVTRTYTLTAFGLASSALSKPLTVTGSVRGEDR